MTPDEYEDLDNQMYVRIDSSTRSSFWRDKLDSHGNKPYWQQDVIAKLLAVSTDFAYLGFGIDGAGFRIIAFTPSLFVEIVGNPEGNQGGFDVKAEVSPRSFISSIGIVKLNVGSSLTNIELRLTFKSGNEQLLPLDSHASAFNAAELLKFYPSLLSQLAETS